MARRTGGPSRLLGENLSVEAFREIAAEAMARAEVPAPVKSQREGL